MIALAHTILVSIYHMLKREEPYKELGESYLENLNKGRTVKNLKKRLEGLLGHTIDLKPQTIA